MADPTEPNGARTASDAKQSSDPYCKAVGRRQYEDATWGGSHVGCSRYGVVKVEGRWVCKLHSDPLKRYGFNDY